MKNMIAFFLVQFLFDSFIQIKINSINSIVFILKLMHFEVVC